MASLWAEIRIQGHSYNQNKIVLFDRHALTYQVTEILKKDSAPTVSLCLPSRRQNMPAVKVSLYSPRQALRAPGA